MRWMYYELLIYYLRKDLRWWRDILWFELCIGIYRRILTHCDHHLRIQYVCNPDSDVTSWKLTVISLAHASAQLMTVPPYVVAAAVMISFSMLSDRCQSRGPFMTVASLIGAFGYLFVSPLLTLQLDPFAYRIYVSDYFWWFHMTIKCGILPLFA